MKDEIIDLETPDGDCQEMKVQRLGDNVFLCKSFIDSFSTFLIFHNDRFEARKLGNKSWRFTKFIEPFDYVRYKIDLGFFCISRPKGNIRIDRERSAQRLTEVIMDGYITEELRNFLDECRGIWEFDSMFGAVVTGYLHIPHEKHREFIDQFPVLCPNIKMEELKEVFSGPREE